MEFPFGRAPLFILITAVVAGVWLGLTAVARQQRRPDLVYATFSKEHATAYRAVIGEFERKHNVHVQFQVVPERVLMGRLQSALEADAAVPDLVEILDGTMGFFARGRLEDVKLVDLTDKVKSSGLYDSLVTSRFTKWSSRGRIFALPHDVHPVMLAYRKDITDQLGIDVTKLTTWDEFCRVGREVATKDLNGDGVPDRYMIDLPTEGGDALRLLLLQHGGNTFDASGDVAFDSERGTDVVAWYVRQVQGKGRIAFPCGWGQNLAKAMLDGLCVFYFCPDWRTAQFEADVPSLKGKLALMPLPAWEPGGLRTSTWGGTGLAITKQCKRPDLAWELAMYLYYDAREAGRRFADTHILPPLRTAWAAPQFAAPSPFYSGQALGREYAALAEQVPSENDSPFMYQTRDKLSEAYAGAQQYYAAHGEDGFRQAVRDELKRCADAMRVVIMRNRFNRPGPGVATANAGGGS